MVMSGLAAFIFLFIFGWLAAGVGRISDSARVIATAYGRISYDVRLIERHLAKIARDE
jgi:hypothetical protein